MNRYRVTVSPGADRQISKLPKADKSGILNKIESLGDNPRPYGFKKLVHYTDFFRVRSGNYRIIYNIVDRELIVSVVEVTDRRDAY